MRFSAPIRDGDHLKETDDSATQIVPHIQIASQLPHSLGERNQLIPVLRYKQVRVLMPQPYPIEVQADWQCGKVQDA